MSVRFTNFLFQLDDIKKTYFLMDNYLVLLVVIIVGFGLYYYFEIVSKRIEPEKNIKEKKQTKSIKKESKKDMKKDNEKKTEKSDKKVTTETSEKKKDDKKKKKNKSKKDSDTCSEISSESSSDLPSVASTESFESIVSLNSKMSINESCGSDMSSINE